MLSIDVTPDSTPGDHLLKLKLIIIKIDKIDLLKLKRFPYLYEELMWTGG
jgi:hypothetical protein